MKITIVSLAILLTSLAHATSDITKTDITSEVKNVTCYDRDKVVANFEVASISANVLAESYLQTDYTGAVTRKTYKIRMSFKNQKNQNILVSVSTEGNFQFRPLDEKIEDTLRTSKIEEKPSTIQKNGVYLNFYDLACTVTLN